MEIGLPPRHEKCPHSGGNHRRLAVWQHDGRRSGDGNSFQQAGFGAPDRQRHPLEGLSPRPGHRPLPGPALCRCEFNGGYLLRLY